MEAIEVPEVEVVEAKTKGEEEDNTIIQEEAITVEVVPKMVEVDLTKTEVVNSKTRLMAKCKEELNQQTTKLFCADILNYVSFTKTQSLNILFNYRRQLQIRG